MELSPERERGQTIAGGGRSYDVNQDRTQTSLSKADAEIKSIIWLQENAYVFLYSHGAIDSKWEDSRDREGSELSVMSLATLPCRVHVSFTLFFQFFFFTFLFISFWL